MSDLIPLFAFEGLRVAVLGLGKSGLVAAKALNESGAEVRAWTTTRRAAKPPKPPASRSST